jgi:hypothetical protein
MAKNNTHACVKEKCEWRTKINNSLGFCMLVNCPYKKRYIGGGKSKNDTIRTEQIKKKP